MTETIEQFAVRGIEGNAAALIGRPVRVEEASQESEPEILFQAMDPFRNALGEGCPGKSEVEKLLRGKRGFENGLPDALDEQDRARRRDPGLVPFSAGPDRFDRRAGDAILGRQRDIHAIGVRRGADFGDFGGAQLRHAMAFAVSWRRPPGAEFLASDVAIMVHVPRAVGARDLDSDVFSVGLDQIPVAEQ